MERKAVRLSTVDNPYNPFTEWKDWLNYDLVNHIDSCAVLARHVFLSDAMTDEENAIAVEKAIDDIVATDPTGQFIKVVEE